jgi:hypothetical protein
MTPSSRAPRLALSISSLALVGVITAACAAGGSDGSSDSPGPASADVAAGADQNQAGNAPEAQRDGLKFDAAAESSADLASLDGDVASTSAESPAPPESDSLSPLVISTGAVALRSDDVEQARFDVQKLVDHFAGQITDEETHTDDEGEIKTSRLVLRIPSASFSDVMTQLEKVADLEMSTNTSEDVTTQVIDNKVRIRVERRSIARIQTLLDRARTIRDIVRIESQLTRRQANLNSTLRKQAYLLDQTSLSTITVSLERAKDTGATTVQHGRAEIDDTGFAAGLNSGWHQLTVAAVIVATVAGVLLPWLVVLLLLAPFGWLAARPVVRRRHTPDAEATA